MLTPHFFKERLGGIVAAYNFGNAKFPLAALALPARRRPRRTTRPGDFFFTFELLEVAFLAINVRFGAAKIRLFFVTLLALFGGTLLHFIAELPLTFILAAS